MSLFTSTIDAVINEIRYFQWKAKQNSITRLFPTFHQRVRDVASKGGIKALSVRNPDTWMFDVASSSEKEPGKSYAVWFHFTNIPDLLKKWVPVKAIWNSDKTNVNYSRLAQEIFNDVDMQSDCECAADTYWGSEYIKTQKKSQYGEDEDRPPVVRNPKKYGIMCKHAHLVWQQLPMYAGTMAKHLKEFWKDEIDEIVKQTLDAEKEEEQPEEEVPAEEPIQPEVKEPMDDEDAVSDEEQIGDNEEEII